MGDVPGKMSRRTTHGARTHEIVTPLSLLFKVCLPAHPADALPRTASAGKAKRLSGASEDGGKGACRKWWRRGESNSGPYYLVHEALQA